MKARHLPPKRTIGVMLQPFAPDNVDDLAPEILMAFFLMSYYYLTYPQEKGR
jgi:hypothetical protein